MQENIQKHSESFPDMERMKSLLLDSIVHDIKNYAAGIEGNATLLAKQFCKEKKVRNTARLISDSCANIVCLASNMRDMGTLENGKLVPEKESITKNMLFELGEMIKSGMLFEEKNITVNLIDKTTGTFTIDADPRLMERMVQNLFITAFKCVPRDGTVTMCLEAVDDESVLCFYISGIPIPDEDKTSLFDKYASVQKKGSPYFKGMGLYYCKLAMEAHQGRIWVETDPKGNYFKLAFKKKPA